MKRTKHFIILGLLLSQTFLSLPVHASGKEGGGGDPLALEFKATASIAAKRLQALNKSPFNNVNFSALLNKISTAQIMIVDTDLPVTKDGFTQNSTAENLPGQNLIVINRASYQKIGSALVEQALALHEFLSLMGDENTGNYPISGQYLIAEGGTPTQTDKTIQSAAQSISVKPPCDEPTGNAAALFAMINDPNVPAQAVQSFVGDHVIGWDVLNDQCETTFLAALSQKRMDVFQALFNQYKPDVSSPQPHSVDSIYSYALKFGSIALIDFIQNSGSSANLQPVYGKEPSYMDGTTPLMLAARYNSTDVVHSMIQSGNAINVADKTGETVTMYAAGNPTANVLQLIIQAGGAVNATDQMGRTAVFNAVNNTSPEALQDLIDANASVNIIDRSYETPLTLAAENALPNVAKTLLKAGANVEGASPSEVTPLILAAWANCYDLVEILLQAGANIHANHDGPLKYAAKKASVRLVQALLKAGADVNDTNGFDDPGKTALMVAAQSNTADVVQALIQAGAKTNLTDSAGWTALLFATRYSTIDSIRLLLQAGADVNVATPQTELSGHGDQGGFTVLQYAAQYNSSDAVKLLVQAGANVNATNTVGETALMFAVGFNSVDAVQSLIRAGANVNAITSANKNQFPGIRKGTPLMYAVSQNSEKVDINNEVAIVRALVQAKADIRAKNSFKETALDIAKEQNAPREVLELLSEGH